MLPYPSRGRRLQIGQIARKKRVDRGRIKGGQFERRKYRRLPDGVRGLRGRQSAFRLLYLGINVGIGGEGAKGINCKRATLRRRDGVAFYPQSAIVLLNASDMPLEYWSVFSNSVFNAIFAPLLVYYFVTFWCYNSDIVESTTLKNTFTVAGGLGFGSDNTGYFLRVPIPGTQESEDIYISSKKGIVRVLLVVFFVAFILYQLIAGGFILNEILQSTYLANHFYVWYIFALCFLCVVFVIYVIYAVTSYTGLFEQRAAGGEINATGQTSVNVCNFGRPILTLLFIAFMTMFAYATIASRFQDGSHHIAGTTDPLTRTNSLYYGSLLTILGFLFISVFFVAKDGRMSLYSTNFTYNPSTASAFYRADGANSSVVAGKHHRGLEMSNKER